MGVKGMIRRFVDDGLHWVVIAGVLIGAAIYWSCP